MPRPFPFTTMSIAWLLLFLSLACLPVSAQQSNYVRVLKDKNGKASKLQVGISHFVLADGRHVDLVGAVHLAEAPYYKELNRRFKTYDRVLYELIIATDGGQAPTGPVVIPKDAENGSSIGQLQLMLCRKLGLQFQLYAIDYSAPNFRHADFTSAELQAAMAKNGESPMSLLVKLFTSSMQSADTDDEDVSRINLFELMTRDPTPEEQRILRRILASDFAQMEQVTSGIQSTSIIAGRNERALDVLRQVLKGGVRNVAVFYGAGHMADMEKRLLKFPGAHLVRREWLTAWHLEDITK
ncbi:MAG: hypothetical protein ACYCW6_16885 [Candidatus Xenobia bacterium]